MQIKTHSNGNKLVAAIFNDDGLFIGQTKNCKDQKQLNREIEKFKKKNAEA